MGKTWSIIIILVLLIGGAIVARVVIQGPVTVTTNAPEAVQGAATVSIDADDAVPPGTDFMVTVDISEVENFDATNYNISFDASVLRLDNVTNGQIDTAVIPVDIWNEIGPGTYTIVQNVPGIPGVTGCGYLAVLHFHALASGQSHIDLSNGVLSDNLAQEVPATWIGDSVVVAAPP